MILKRYVAVDKDGQMYAFEERPKRNGEAGIWYCEGGGVSDNLMDVKERMPLELSKKTWRDEPVEVIIVYRVEAIRKTKQKRYSKI